MQTHYLACDLGAESGRLVRGSIWENRLEIEELHRFPNRPVHSGDSLHWNVDSLHQELLEGLRQAAKLELPIRSVSCNSWGVDYLLLDKQGQVLAPTFHYRDPRTAAGLARVLERCDWPAIFQETGIQLMPINALFQLGAEQPGRLQQAGKLLGIGDGFNYLLGGQPVVEKSMASTFQLYNPRTGRWSDKLCRAAGVPEELLPDIVASGTSIGKLTEEAQRITGLGELNIIATCSHDTGAAVAAIPFEDPNHAYLSSGTWSLLGVELPRPVITDHCRDLNFTNEIGANETVRLLKNLSGLWLLQESRKAWAADGQNFDYSELTAMAAQAPGFSALIDPSDELFTAPDDMNQAIDAYCSKTGQPTPGTPGKTTRCILESLALIYRRTIEELESLIQRPIPAVHIVGGGSKNHLLNQFTANATGRPVLAGPVEATAIGNLAIQALVGGDLSNWKAVRELARRSFPLERYQPQNRPSWEQAASRFNRLPRFQSSPEAR